MYPGLRNQFRAALVGMYLAEWKFGGASSETSNWSGLERHAQNRHQLEPDLPTQLLTQDSATQLLYLVPWLLQQHGNVSGCMQLLTQVGYQDNIQQMAGLLVCSLEHLFDQQGPQTLLATIAQRLSQPHNLSDFTQAQLMIDSLGQHLQQPLPTASLDIPLPLVLRKFPGLFPVETALFPVETALYSFLRIPESYSLAVKYAFDCTHSSVIAAFTGLLAGASGGLAQMPIPWLISWLTAMETTLALPKGGGWAKLWPILDVSFAQWAGSLPEQLTGEVRKRGEELPVLPVPSI